MNMDFQRQRSELAIMPSYAAIEKVAPDAVRFGESLRTLFQWKESIYKLLWKHAILYFLIYTLLTCLHRYGLGDDGKKTFEQIADYCKEHSKGINVSVMLAFFTNEALRGYMKLSLEMPGTFRTTATFIMSLKPNIPECRALVATYSRWQVLCWVLTFRMICKPLRRVFPDLVSLKRAGLLLEHERIALEQEQASGVALPRPLIVIEWMMHLLRECLQREYFFSTYNILTNTNALMSFKKKAGNTIKYSLDNIPKPITQAVIIAVYTVGILTILGRDLEDNDKKPTKRLLVDFFPILPSLQFFVYLSWLSIGRAAVHPFGDDENDIDITKYVNNHFDSAQRLQSFYNENYHNLFTKYQDVSPQNVVLATETMVSMRNSP